MVIKMAEFEYGSLEQKYDGFELPVAVVIVNKADFSKNKYGLVLTEIDIELTSGFEAAIASFHIYNAFDDSKTKYLLEQVKKYILLGSCISIHLGYGNTVENVFCGYIARVNFVYDEVDAPYIKVTAMDVKGIMMSNNYARQIKKGSYGEAVKEILEKTAYKKLQERGVIASIKVTNTPDYKAETGDNRKESAETIEMVSESDYEFIVKAAKKFNYEFYTDMGIVYFRKAKAVTDILMEIGPDTGLHNIDVEYDITGLVERVEARGMDAGKAKVISAEKKSANTISNGNKAARLIKGSSKVMIDASIHSKEMAQYRADSLQEEMAYRFGSLTCEVIGLPELIPGRFIRLVKLGEPVVNTFYVTKVHHVMGSEKGFYTRIEGKAAKIEKER